MMPLRSLHGGPLRGFVRNRNFLLNYLRRQEGVEMRIEGENGVVGHSLQELVQSFHPGLHKLLRKAIHHALHHKLLWQRLHKKTGGGESEQGGSPQKGGRGDGSAIVSLTGMRWVGWLSSNLILSQSKSW